MYSIGHLLTKINRRTGQCMSRIFIFFQELWNWEWHKTWLITLAGACGNSVFAIWNFLFDQTNHSNGENMRMHAWHTSIPCLKSADIADTIRYRYFEWNTQLILIRLKQLPIYATRWQHGSQICFATFT